MNEQKSGGFLAIVEPCPCECHAATPSTPIACPTCGGSGSITTVHRDRPAIAVDEHEAAIELLGAQLQAASQEILDAYKALAGMVAVDDVLALIDAAYLPAGTATALVRKRVLDSLRTAVTQLGEKP